MNWEEKHRTKPGNDDGDEDKDDDDDYDYDDDDRCTKTSLCFYYIYFICRWFGVIIELKKITLECKLATLQIEADHIIVKTTSSLGRQGKARGDSI